jgi:serine/threonine protein kinase
MYLPGGGYSQAIDVFSIGCVLGELLHCLPAAAGPDRSSRILFDFQPAWENSSRDDPGNFEQKKFANFVNFFPVLGKPSQQDVEEYARAAGEAAVSEVVEYRGTARDDYAESFRRKAVDEVVQVLTTGKISLYGIETWQGGSAPISPVDLAAKYSTANTECPAAVALLLRMLTYSPSNRISCSEALRHQFLNPDGAEAAAGDDGHERAERSAAQLQQLNIDGFGYECVDAAFPQHLRRSESLCYSRIYAMLMRVFKTTD